jgi:hypothetical protein
MCLYRSVIGLKNMCRYNSQNEVLKQPRERDFIIIQQNTSIPVYNNNEFINCMFLLNQAYCTNYQFFTTP